LADLEKSEKAAKLGLRRSRKNREKLEGKIVINPGKNRSSYTVSDAARLLGVSIPTVKRMQGDHQLEGFRTPGGHLRVTAESIAAVKESTQANPRAVRGPSPVLQNRRERVEEITLETQELRAKQELENLRREEQEERGRREAEAQARRDETAERQAQLDLERKRLDLQKAQERSRQQQEQAETRRKAAVERELAAFRLRWHGKASEEVSANAYRWLSARQRKEVLDGLENEIEKRQPADEPRLPVIIARSLAALVEPLRAEHDAQETRQRLTNEVLGSLSFWTTEAEKVRATVAIREALKRFDTFADVGEMRLALQDAVEPVRLATEERRAEEVRKARKADLVRQGLDEVFFYQLHLERAGQIEWDSEFNDDLKEIVQRRLEADLSGDETQQNVKALVREIIDGELEEVDAEEE
jgi:excisionase family DNA binding protein